MTSNTSIRCFRDLSRIDDYLERFEYLRLRSTVGVSTFGSDRWLNQAFYTSTEWRRVRDIVISRDWGRDLGVEGYEIPDQIIVHHMNPMAVADIVDGDASILDPEYLISVSLLTHNAIHYGDASLLRRPLVERQPGDTRLW